MLYKYVIFLRYWLCAKFVLKSIFCCSIYLIFIMASFGNIWKFASRNAISRRNELAKKLLSVINLPITKFRGPYLKKRESSSDQNFAWDIKVDITGPN